MDDFILNNDTYYTPEANKRFCSVHQFLDFAGWYGMDKCEARAMATLNGEYIPETTKAMTMGSFCDSFFEGTLDKFKEEHPEIFTKDGKKLLSDYKLCEKMIDRCTRDEMFMKYMSGKKQVIMTADIYGVPFKIKIDSYIPDVLICDFKTSSNIRKSWYIPELGHTDFIQYWGYTVQLAIYQKVVEINTGKKLPCYIAVVTKEDDPDIEVIYVSQNTLDETMELIREKIPEVQKIKDGEIKPVRCENCAYCRRTKKLIKPISQVDLIQNI